MYTCGITPYDATHLGHATVYVVYDVLQRRLRDLGHDTRCVRNITDVDDPLLAKAKQLGVHYLDLAAGEVARFDSDMKALNVLPVYSEPRATSAIPTSVASSGWCSTAATRIRPAARCTSTSRRSPASARSATTPRRDDRAAPRARRQRRRPVQAQPPRLRALAAVGRRGADVGDDVGTRSSRVAHRVLGARRSASSARRSISTVAAPT